MAPNSSKFLERFGYDLLLGSIVAFYAFMVPYTKVEESFNVQGVVGAAYTSELAFDWIIRKQNQFLFF
ncbi:Dol-P-Man:Man(7)GlcNAc(2)-PP-Dol alpha-1,6-mannosyltransferase [Cucurbita argyrosperma subsp. argyrosperma]|nr:Dol-P-Man:Man(7)GlcNAc(2)-PP-Dol alpha-1,6-mannosyltransferase [Cucurbita argyrosperma subsp. argyrosperma]